MTEYTMLPETENFLRLEDCNFNTIEEYETKKTKDLKNSTIPGTLKNNINPLLVLFYYENTDSKILTEFFESSNGENLETGKKDDSIFEGEDIDFKFGFVNLDSEPEILKTFQVMNGLNPFSWAKIEFDPISRTFEKYPFIIFYYNTLPQFMYEGAVDSQTIKLEFKNWRKELIEIENKEMIKIKERELTKEGYFTALQDDKPIMGIVKGTTYWISVTEDPFGTYDYTITPI